MSKCFIEIKDLSKIFHNNGNILKVFENISIEIPTGSFVTFLGPSGCGKTTLLRVISSLDKDFRGSIKIASHPITKKDRGRFGFVFQESSLLPWNNVTENIFFLCKLLDKKANIKNLVELVGLAGFEKYYPDELSGGMQKRVALARALATEPSVLFMDEPFGSLDEFTRRKMHDLLLNLQKKLKFTVIFVTHNVDEAILLSDKIVTLSGKPTQIKSVYDASDVKHAENKIKKGQKYLDLLDKIYKDFDL